MHESATHEKEFELFTQSIPEATRLQWLSMIACWESDQRTQPDPYNVVTECTLHFPSVVSTLTSVRSQDSGRCAS